MRIKQIKTYIVSQQLGGKRFCYSQNWYDSRTIMLVEVITEDGVSGFGEAFGNAYINRAVIENAYKARLIGKHVFDTEAIWDDLYNYLRDSGQKGSCIQALSAIDNALWDLKGKYTHLPVYQLLGGARRDKILPYATGLYPGESDTLEKDLVEEAVSYVEQGFRAIKMKIGFGVKKDIELVRNVRRAIGDDIDLMVDANHAYNSLYAIQVAKGIEEYNIKWFEEPVPPEDIEGYKDVKAATSIPLAGGEAEFTRYGMKRFIDERAADILNPDCSITGGLSEFMKIVTLAKIANIQCFPHVWGSGVAVQVGLNAAFAVPDFPESLNPEPVYFELDRTPNIFREELNLNPLIIKDGYIERPFFEGLGFEVNRELIKKYEIR